MSTSTPKRSKKYPLLLEAGKKLIWKYGIRKVSIEEVCKEAGVSKMTFYRIFDNKYKLAKAILEEVYEENMQRYLDLMASDLTFPEKIETIIKMKMEGTSEISDELIKDIYTIDDPELKELIDNQRINSMNVLIKDFLEAQQDGWLREEVKPEFFLIMQQKMFEMLMDPQIVAMFGGRKEAIPQLTRFFFWGLSGKPHE